MRACSERLLINIYCIWHGSSNSIGGPCLARVQRRTLIFSFILSTLFVPGILGSAITPRWAFAAVMLPVLISNRQAPFTVAHVFGLLFIAYAAVSISWSHHYDGLKGLFELIVVAEAFVYGSRLESLKPTVIGFGLGMWVSSAVMLLGIDIPHVTDHAGLFVNSNLMGEIAGLVLVAALAYRIWWLVPGILPAFLLAHCRGAFIAVAGAFVLWVWSKSRLAAAGLCVAVLVALIYMSASPSAQERLMFWSAVVPHLTLPGSGLGSFYTMYPLYVPGVDEFNIRAEHLHNDWLEYVFELGIGSVLLIPVLWGSYSIVSAAFVIEACFGFPLRMPATAVLGGIVAGYAVRDRADVRDLCAAWRIRFRKWAERGGRQMVSARTEVSQG